MLKLDDNMLCLESTSELPDFPDVHTIYLDIETQNNTGAILETKNVGGRYCFKGDKVGSIAVTVDDCPHAVYIPLRHTHESRQFKNLDIDQVYGWLRNLFGRAKRWANHNVVFDALFLANEGVPFPPSLELWCTLTLCKIHDSDRLRSGLKEVSRDWLEIPMEEEDEVDRYLDSLGGPQRERNYMDVPIDILGRYACMDTLANRRLTEFLLHHRPEDMKRVWDVETKLTPILFDMEWRGLRIDPTICKVEHLKAMKRMVKAATAIHSLTDREFTNSNQCIHDILVNQLGLPVLEFIVEKDEDDNYVETDRATFNKFALAQYEVHPEVTSNPAALEIVRHIAAYRQEQQFDSLFATTFIDLHDDNDHVHPHYNPIVRTGRMSCSKPNSQQQNKRSKALILPDEGYGFISSDYSQIEFRLIAHYIRDHATINAYRNDPNTDFHSWVADLLGVDRAAGKTLNFGMAYGAGKAKVSSGLVTNPLIIETIGEHVNQQVEAGKINPKVRTAVFETLCQQRAAAVYQSYHEALPGIKATSNRAASAAKYKGYVFNWLGRRRYLPEEASRKAFNAVIQGGAMDIMKERMVAISPRYNATTRGLGIDLAWNVHDNVGLHTPLEEMSNPKVHDFVCDTMEDTVYGFDVPIKIGLGFSGNSWAEEIGRAHV